MKKLFIMTALVAGLLSSCSEDDFETQSIVDNNTIAFATNKAKALTRSGETITSINKFTVSAVNDDNTSFFSNEEYTYNSESGVFKSQVPHYWPTTGTLSFYAISNIGAYSTDANNVLKYTYSNWEAEKDLVAATVKSGEKEIPYPLTFRHLTSQIYVSAEAENKTQELTYKLVSVKMAVPSAGTYSFATSTGGVGTWEIDNTKTSEYSYSEALPMSFKQNGQIELSSCYWNILPVTDGEINFTIEYQVFQNGKLIADYTGSKYKECIIDKPGLIAGKRYGYNFILVRGTDDEITFTTTMTDWTDGAVTNHIPTDGNVTNTYEYVDLGLPSGLKWATLNVGAQSVEEAGYYFAFAETTGHNLNGTGNYVFSQGPILIGAGNLPLSKDAANAYWGGNWRMPTYAEFDELIAHTTREVATINGVEGMKFYKGQGNNVDKSVFIFFPHTGLYQSSTLENTSGGYYRTSSNPEGSYGKYFCFGGSSVSMSNGNFGWGMAIRPVCN